MDDNLILCQDLVSNTKYDHGGGSGAEIFGELGFQNQVGAI